MAKKKKWLITAKNNDRVKNLAQKLSISAFIAQILLNRDINNEDEIRKFLALSPSLWHSPLLLEGVAEAVDHINRALERKEKIMVYGDYDVDGITATALLYQYLSSRGADICYHIPDRMTEGYGLNCPAIEKAKEMGVSLIITVDCGISAIRETELAHALGMTMIITDHHQPGAELPLADAVIDPKIASSAYPFPHLAGVGVAWKLAQALELSRGMILDNEVVLEEYLDLVCFGTIGDVVPLIGENRLIAALGLKLINQGKRPGIKALLNINKMEDKKITAGQVGFILAPRINALGRISRGDRGIELLVSQDEEECLEIAQTLNEVNFQRQQLEAGIYQEALAMIEENPEHLEHVLVLASESWHQGVIGIVASRLVEQFYRPVIMLSIEGEMAKGSARSIPEFDIFTALKNCQERLVGFGGHKQAAGLKLKKDDIGVFAQQLNKYAGITLNKDELFPKIHIDREIDCRQCDEALMADMEKLHPFGQDNPDPVFMLRKMRVTEIRTVGVEKKHLKIRLTSQSRSCEGIGFNLGGAIQELECGSIVDLVFTLERNTWQGRVKLQLNIKDIQPHPYQYIENEQDPIDRERPHKIHDFRNVNDKIRYVREIAQTWRQCLLYVATKKQADELLYLLHERAQERDCWEYQLINNEIIAINAVSAEGSPESCGGTEQVIFYHPPKCYDDFSAITGWQEDVAKEIHLIYQDDDLVTLNQQMRLSLPDRDLLGKMYLSLKRILSDEGKIIKAKEQLIEIWQSSGIPQWEEKTADAWLLIMQELGLIRLAYQGNLLELEFISLGEKLSLESSASYQSYQREKTAYQIWETILDATDFLKNMQENKFLIRN